MPKSAIEVEVVKMPLVITIAVPARVVVRPGSSEWSKKVENTSVMLTTSDEFPSEKDTNIAIHLVDGSGNPNVAIVSLKDLQNACYALQRAAKEEDCF